MTLDAQVSDIQAEITHDVLESAYSCELEYHMAYMMSEMQKAQDMANSEVGA